jgi:hypothetical protein
MLAIEVSPGATSKFLSMMAAKPNMALTSSTCIASAQQDIGTQCTSAITASIRKEP